MAGKPKDLTGQRFGRLVVIEATDQRRGDLVIWRCRCDCGNEKLAVTSDLKKGHAQSCGCLQRDIALNNSAHGTNEIFIRAVVEGKAKLSARNTSGVQGVSWDKKMKKWIATIGFQRRLIRLGYYDNLDDAAKARRAAEERYFGKFLEDLNEDRDEE